MTQLKTSTMPGHTSSYNHTNLGPRNSYTFHDNTNLNKNSYTFHDNNYTSNLYGNTKNPHTYNGIIEHPPIVTHSQIGNNLRSSDIGSYSKYNTPYLDGYKSSVMDPYLNPGSKSSIRGPDLYSLDNYGHDLSSKVNDHASKNVGDRLNDEHEIKSKVVNDLRDLEFRFKNEREKNMEDERRHIEEIGDHRRNYEESVHKMNERAHYYNEEEQKFHVLNGE